MRRNFISLTVVSLSLLSQPKITSSFVTFNKVLSVFKKEPYLTTCQQSSKNLEFQVQNSQQKQNVTGVYIHIPFCRRRCRYCDFAIVPIGTRTSIDDNLQSEAFQRLSRNYTDAVVQEINAIRLPNNNQKILLASIYFGGGTPSLAPPETIQRILQAMYDGPFVLEPNAEITIEMDPGRFTLEKAKIFRNLGFNRISFGVQSFDDVILQSLGRVHRNSDIKQALDILNTVYGEEMNYSIDLISGLPGQSLATWIETLDTAVKLKPPPTHLSLYDLQIESVSSSIREGGHTYSFEKF